VLNAHRFALSLLALIVAYGAQLLLDGQLPGAWTTGWSPAAEVNLAGGLYLAAMALFGLAALPPEETATARHLPMRASSGRRTGEPAVAVEPPAHPRRLAPLMSALRSRGLPLARWLLVLGAIALAVAASVIFWHKGENSGVRWIWLVSVGLLLLSQLPESVPRAKLAHGWRCWTDVLMVFSVVAAAFLLRFYRVESLPQDLHGDMASHGLEARSLLEGRPALLFSTRFYQIPTMAFVPAALSMAVFGNNLFGLNMTSVIGGTLSVLGLYLLVRELMEGLAGRRASLLAAALLAVSYVHIHFSRIAQYMDPWPFALFSLYLLVRGLRRGERLSYVGSGVLLAICFQMYYAGRILPLIIAAFVLLLALLRQGMLRGSAAGLALLVLAALVTTGPMIPFFIRHPYDFVARSQAVFLSNPEVITHLMDKYRVSSVGGILLEQVKRSLLMFHQSIDSSTQFALARPMLDSYTSPLLVLGLGLTLRRLRHPLHLLAMAWLSLVLVIGSMLTNNAPFWPRLVGILPPAVLLVALALERMWALVERMWGETSSVLAALLLVVVLVFVGERNWHLYVGAVENNAMPRTRIGRYLYGLDAQVNACMVSDPYQLSIRETAFLAYPRATIDLPSDASAAALDACAGPRRVYILTDNHLDVLPWLLERYPGGVTEEHRDPGGALVFVSYLVGPEDRL
jgi:4-amino-4-deoxy-L-arabinose transferase-like glycosyltransferase